ncbi:uncharacterized protein B0H18DRAFT_969591 [Fomitopsis serialis]|uniref:uncharacterized protein n=1 Tax=Fomitopsis serialis TaxID=139415 RepID=UPI002007B0D7|nr:uncharacterized protein B0H18DRAFT_969591 [Neoantrodia serialis]KAH9937212.1 hypothetical protein B0H18DRAFT_969591 [Neoantrodia serialis]
MTSHGHGFNDITYQPGPQWAGRPHFCSGHAFPPALPTSLTHYTLTVTMASAAPAGWALPPSTASSPCGTGLESAELMSGPSDTVRSAVRSSESTSGPLDPTGEAATDGPAASIWRPSIPSHTSTASSLGTEAGALGHFVRSDTLLSFGRSQTRNAAELKALMGNSNSRLKTGATVHVAARRKTGQNPDDTQADAVALEHAKSRSRVEVDIVLDSDTSSKVRVRKRSRKDEPICLADPKIRVIGFECIPGESERHTFYQCASPLSAITDGLDRLFDAPTGSDGFTRAIEGMHTLPFAMRLPVDSKFGAAKGVLNLHSGVIVQYIAMISIKVKDPKTGKRSIAHFFRNCEIWPRLNASILLASAPRPLQVTTTKSLAMLSNERKVKLTAQLHRLTWVAGQRCYVNVSVVNDTKKTVKTLTLMLVRSTTMFRPTPELDAGRARSVDPDACQTTTLHKVVAENVLEMAQPGTKGRASAKGWWTGVGPGKELSFSHYILIPPEALSVTRSRLLEVEYSIRVTLSAGPLTPDVHGTLPIRVINFLSIDPIPSEPSHSFLVEPVHPLKRRRSIDGELDALTEASLSRNEVPPVGLMPGDDDHNTARPRQGPYHVLCNPVHEAQTHSLRITNPDQVPSSLQASESSDSEASVYSSDASYHSSVDELASSSGVQLSSGLGNLDLEDPNSDEEVEYVVGSARLDEELEDPTIAGPEYGTSRATVSRPMGPRSGSRSDRRNTINVGALPPREYRNVRDETERRARDSFVDDVNERLLAAATSLHATPRRRARHPVGFAYSSDEAMLDMDATPRLSQDQIRPLRPSRHLGRRTPAPSVCASVGMGTTAAEPTPTACSALSQSSVRRSRALPPLAAQAVGPANHEGLPVDEQYPIARFQQAISVTGATGGGNYVTTTPHIDLGCHPPHTHAVIHKDIPRELDGASFRGRTAHIHPPVGNAARSESSSSASTSSSATSSSGYDSGHSYETSVTSVHSADGRGRPTAGMQMAGASESAVPVQGRIAEFEDRVRCVRPVASAFV